MAKISREEKKEGRQEQFHISEGVPQDHQGEAGAGERPASQRRHQVAIREVVPGTLSLVMISSITSVRVSPRI